MRIFGKMFDTSKLALLAAALCMGLISLLGFFLPLLAPNNPATRTYSHILQILTVKRNMNFLICGIILGPTAGFGSIAVLQSVSFLIVSSVIMINWIRFGYSNISNGNFFLVISNLVLLKCFIIIQANDKKYQKDDHYNRKKL